MTTYSDLSPEKQAEVREVAKRIAAEDGVDLQALLFLIGATDDLPKPDQPNAGT